MVKFRQIGFPVTNGDYSFYQFSRDGNNWVQGVPPILYREFRYWLKIKDYKLWKIFYE